MAAYTTRKTLPASAPPFPAEKNHLYRCSLQPLAVAAFAAQEILPASAPASTERNHLYRGRVQPLAVAACTAQEILPASAPASTERNHLYRGRVQPLAVAACAAHEILPASAPASPIEKNHCVHRSLRPPAVAACAAKKNSSSLCTSFSYRKESLCTQQLTAYSLQLWQLAQPRNSSSLCTSFSYRKYTVVQRQLTASNCGSLCSQRKFLQPLQKACPKKNYLYKETYSLQLWQLTQSVKLSQPLQHIFLQKGINFYRGSLQSPAVAGSNFY